MTGLIITLAFLLSFIPDVMAFDGPSPMDARRSPGMEGRGPGFDQSNIKFEFIADNKIFKDEEEAKNYQTLFDLNKDSKEIRDYFSQMESKKKENMDEMRRNDVRPDFNKMKEERLAEQVTLIKDLKLILDKKKTAVVSINKDNVKCEAAKSPAVLEKANIDSLKDTSKVVKVVLTTAEFEKIKKDIKDEVKKEMMNDMAKSKPKEEDKPEQREKRSSPREDKNDGEKKMAGGPGGSKKQMQQREGGPQGGSQGGSQGYGQVDMSFFQNQNSGMQMQQQQMPSMNQNSGMQMNQGQQRPRGQNRQMGMGQGYNFGQGQYAQNQQQRPQMQMPPQMQNMNSQFDNGYNVNYNGQSVGYSSPYNFYQYRPYEQYPMMGMGN